MKIEKRTARLDGAVMSEAELRRNAAALARDCRSIRRKGQWRIKEWNDKIRSAIQSYMSNIRYFERANRS